MTFISAGLRWGARRRASPHARRRVQGYLDERSTHHAAGWLRDLDAADRRLAFEIVVPSAAGERILHRGIADAFSGILVQVGVGDGRYAFEVRFDAPLTEAERDALLVREPESGHVLECAPALKTAPPGEGGRSPEFQGYVDELSTRHAAGWVRDIAHPEQRIGYEIVLPSAGGERILHRGVADAFSPLLQSVGVGDGGYGFYTLLPEELTAADRDAVFVRPAGSDHRLQNAPALRTGFEPISHLAMDIVNNCNLRCPFCVYDYSATHRTQFMDEATFASALRLIPYVTDGNFWLSCLHEATLHPRLTGFIARVPEKYRRKLFYTTNLAKRMPDSYFRFLAASGMHHLNISLESLDAAIYEAMRKGARHRIFAENWEKLLAAFAAAPAPPRLRYNIMAYRSNLQEIPALVEHLRRDRMGWQIEVRHTFEEPHIPAEFRAQEFLSTAEWAWLSDQLGHFRAEDVLLIAPPGGIGYDPAAATASDGGEAAREGARPAASPAVSIPKPLNLSMDWDGTLRVYGEQPRAANQPPAHVNYVVTNIRYLTDPIRFLLSL